MDRGETAGKSLEQIRAMSASECAKAARDLDAVLAGKNAKAEGSSGAALLMSVRKAKSAAATKPNKY